MVMQKAIYSHAEVNSIIFSGIKLKQVQDKAHALNLLELCRGFVADYVIWCCELLWTSPMTSVFQRFFNLLAQGPDAPYCAVLTA
jgi:hypothetical protein